MTSVDRWNYMEPEHSATAFRGMDQLFFTRPVGRSGPVYELKRSELSLDFRYVFEGKELEFKDHGERSWTTGLIVLRGDEILHEEYREGAVQGSQFVSFSMAKAIAAILVGIAVDEGRIESLRDPVTRYVSDLQGTAYDGVPIKDILQMSSGTAFNGKFDNPDSDMRKLDDTINEGRSTREVVKGTRREREPGQVFHYSSIDSQLLSWLLTEATRETVSSYTERKLWAPLGAERDAYWVVDQDAPHGLEAVCMGFNATLRDYARLGLLMARGGLWRGTQVLPAGWVREATIPDSPHVDYGRLHPSSPLGFQYQWWCSPGDGDDRVFMSHGAWGQLLLVNPGLDLVMVKLSNWPKFWLFPEEYETYAVFEGIANVVRRLG